jgi:hypothetical protein
MTRIWRINADLYLQNKITMTHQLMNGKLSLGQSVGQARYPCPPYCAMRQSPLANLAVAGGRVSILY